MEYIIKKTETFNNWLSTVNDRTAFIAINRRLDRASRGNFGDHKAVGDGVSEMRVDVGAGYRLYYTIRGKQVVFLLNGGDKSSQKTDIAKAKEKVKEV